MPPRRMPGTNKIWFVPEHSGDHVFELTQWPDIDLSIAQEDVLITGNWEDYDGSGTRGPTAVQMEGVENGNQMDLDALDANVKDYDRTLRGNIATLYRQRGKLVCVES